LRQVGGNLFTELLQGHQSVGFLRDHGQGCPPPKQAYDRKQLAAVHLIVTTKYTKCAEK
jgi:hypothetical protein